MHDTSHDFKEYQLARSSWGTIRKLPSKKFQASYLGPDQRRHKAPTTFTTKTLARLWLDEQRLAIEKGIWVEKQTAPSVPDTLKSFAESHIRLQTNARGQHLRKNTKDTYTRLLALHLVEFHEIPINKISKRQVDEWWHKKVQTGISTTASKAYKLLHAVLKRAVADGLIAENPCKIRGAHSLTTGKRKEIPTPQEVGQLIKAIDSNYKLVLILMSYGGLRFSEATALTAKDLKIVGKSHEKHFEVQVSKAVTESNGVFTVAEPKSRASKRTIALPQQFTLIIAKQLLERKLTTDSQLLVEAPHGGYLRNSVFRKALASACKKTGLQRIHLSAHCFRHFAATTYLEAGASIADLQTWLGDRTQSAALGYIHATKDKRQLANSMRIEI